MLLYKVTCDYYRLILFTWSVNSMNIGFDGGIKP